MSEKPTSLNKLVQPSLFASAVVALSVTATNAQELADRHFAKGPLSRLLDCSAAAEVLTKYYSDYRTGTGDESYIEQERRSAALRDQMVNSRNKRINSELPRPRDMDAANAHLRWIYETSQALPDFTGYGNAVAIFENRIGACLLEFDAYEMIEGGQ